MFKKGDYLKLSTSNEWPDSWWFVLQDQTAKNYVKARYMNTGEDYDDVFTVGLVVMFPEEALKRRLTQVA